MLPKKWRSLSRRQIIGADVAIAMACEASELELNMAEPIIAFNLLLGLTLLRNAAIVLNARCIAGIQANRSVYELVLEKNLLTKAQLDDILKPENMTHPRKLTPRSQRPG